MLILPSFNVGDTATLYAPVALSCRLTAPDGVTTTIVRSGLKMNIQLSMAGTWRYQFSDGSSGELVAVEPARHRVRL